MPTRGDPRRLRAQGGAIGCGQRRCAGRRCSASVGDEITDGEIGFVSDAADNRDARLEYGERDGLFVECPQVFERSATAANDEHIDLGPRVGDCDRRRDLRGRGRALHCAWIDDDPKSGETTPQRYQHVPQCGRLGRRYDPHRVRERRYRTLALDAEPACALESQFEPRKFLEQCALAG